jgi:hypothetical protein
MDGSMKNVPKPPKINTEAYSKMLQRYKTREAEWYKEIRKIGRKSIERKIRNTSKKKWNKYKNYIDRKGLEECTNW